MPRKGHAEEGSVAVLHQVESGAKVAGVCRKVGISEGTFYNWKKQYAGLGISELRELRLPRDENGRLKRLVANLSLDRQILQEVVSKKLEGLGCDGSWPSGRRKSTGSANGVRRG
jgi:putative transposase